jgi:hypothetical protein
MDPVNHLKEAYLLTSVRGFGKGGYNRCKTLRVKCRSKQGGAQTAQSTNNIQRPNTRHAEAADKQRLQVPVTNPYPSRRRHAFYYYEDSGYTTTVIRSTSSEVLLRSSSLEAICTKGLS